MVMTIAERNRAIKKALTKVFGKNVSVRGSRGTAYGWVKITIKTKKPHTGECSTRPPFGAPYMTCYDCRAQREKIESKVWDVLKKSGLASELSSYYDDMNMWRKEIIIDVERT